MNKEFITSIYKQNSSEKGREKLYHELSAIEASHWFDIEKNQTNNWTELFTQKTQEFSNNIVIKEVDTQNSFTYEELDKASENIKNYILSNVNDYKIGLNYQNSFAFMATLIGINKAGRLAILFNNREPKIRIKSLAFNAEVKTVFGNNIEGLNSLDIEQILKSDEVYTLKYEILKTTLEDPAFVIFTSGTSGPSKPALFSHKRMIGAGVAWSLRTAMQSSDNCYIPLPLYHGNALAVAFSSVVYAGATAILRPKFSVKEFWIDINKYECSHMVYIGELWRYLINSNTHINNPNKSLKVIFGNGLNESLWNDVVNTYNINHVVEHFGSTEMPSGALTNWMNVAGYCGYLPPKDPRLQEMVLVDETFKSVKTDEHGEALFLVPTGKYRGYLDENMDAPKIYKNLFKDTDVWWRSNDLLKVNAKGFYTFVERLGDTYRFKGENVACVDVEEALRQSEVFEEVAVYGIVLPNTDGKIGMASLVTSKKFSLQNANELLEKLKEKLAPYALPYVLKIQNTKHKTTSTLKIQKAHLAKEALSTFKSSLHYILVNGSYEKLDNVNYGRLLKSEITLSLKAYS